MDPDVVAAFVVPISFCAMIVAVVFRVYSHRRSGAQPTGDASAFAAVEQRLARVEVALDDVTTELGRLGQGQQFLTKVLTDRAAEAPAISSRP